MQVQEELVSCFHAACGLGKYSFSIGGVDFSQILSDPELLTMMQVNHVTYPKSRLVAHPHDLL